MVVSGAPCVTKGLTNRVVFRDMVTAGSGELKVQLDEKAITLKQFEKFIDTETFTHAASEGFCLFDQVLAFVRFLDKYQCDRALRHFLVDLEAKVQTEWPALLLFMSGVYLGKLELCIRALDAPARRRTSEGLNTWPRGMDLRKVGYSLDPDIIPYHILEAMPLPHLLALHNTEGLRIMDSSSSKWGQRNLFGRNFRLAFEDINHRIALGKPSTTQ